MISTQIAVFFAAIALKMRFHYSTDVAVKEAKAVWHALEREL